MTTQTRASAQPTVIEVNERDFQAQVLERSQKTPVVVDFWAPWCGPCRALSPTLERLAREAQGAFILAKINVDQNPSLAQAFQVQGIPAVKAVHHGRVVDEFTGALPEPQVRAWLKRFLPSPSDDLVAAAAALEQHNPDEAAARYRVALGDDPNNTDALFGLGRLLVLQGDPEGVAALSQIPQGTPLYPRAQGWLVLANFFAQANENAQSWAAQLAAQPDDLEQQYRQAAQAARSGQYEVAINQLLAIVQRNRSFRDDGARKSLIALFDALGSQDPLVVSGRRRLANALF